MNSTLRPGLSPDPWYRQFWPWFLIALPATSVVFSFVTLALCVRNADSLVREDYYRAGLAFNRDRAAEKAAASKNLHATLRVDPATLRLLVHLTGEGPDPAAPLHLELKHPTQPARDRSVLLAPQGGNAFDGQVEGDLRGPRDVVLAPEDGSWRLAGRVEVPPPGESFVLRVP